MSIDLKAPSRAARSDQTEETGPWDSLALAQFRVWEAAWVDECLDMSRDPWTSGVLPRKDVELISIAVNAACTNLSPEGTRRHIRGALEAGATQEEILMVLKVASLLSIHTCSLGAPILLEEAKAAGVKPTRNEATTPVCDKMKAAGQWNAGVGRVFRDCPGMDRKRSSAVSLPVYTSGALLAQAGGIPEHRRRCVDHAACTRPEPAGTSRRR